jgi:hypothetical protein
MRLVREAGEAGFDLAANMPLSGCGVPKFASCLQIVDFSRCAPSFGTPQLHTYRTLGISQVSLKQKV